MAPPASARGALGAERARAVRQGALIATGSDESMESFGTLIGQNFGLHSQGNLSAAYGTPVDQIGGGDFSKVGTQDAGSAATSGTLKLHQWDSNFGDNARCDSANAATVPDPDAYALMPGGLAAVGFVAWRRRVG